MIEPDRIRRYERELAAMIRVASTDDPDAFAVIVQLLDEARAQLPAACQTMRQQGYSWAEIAAPLGTTRQAAHDRFGRAA